MQYMKQSTVTDSSNPDKLSDKDLEAKLKEMRKWDKLDMKQIASEQEILFIDQHYCNNNLEVKINDDFESDDDGKPVFKDETFAMKPQAIINQNDSKRFTLKEAEKEFGESKEQERFRLENNKVALEEIKNRIEQKKYL